jgi:ankyrin repeat protein
MYFNYYVVIFLSLPFSMYVHGMEQQGPAKRQRLEDKQVYEEARDEDLDDEKKALYIAFYDAIEKGDLEEVKKYVAQGADVKAHYPEYEFTPIEWSAQYGHLPIVKFLIQKGAPLEDEKATISPLTEAVESGHREVAEFLLSLGVNPDGDYTLDTPLHSAVENNSTEITKLLLKARADVNSESDDMFPLQVAIKGNNKELVKLLIKKGAYVNAMTNLGKFPLHYIKGDQEIIKELVDNGAHLDRLKKKQNKFNMVLQTFKSQPFSLAALCGNVDEIKKHIALLDTSSTLGTLSPADRQKMVNEALKYAVAQGRKEAVLCLLGAGAEVSEALIKLVKRTLDKSTWGDLMEDKDLQDIYQPLPEILISRASLKEQILHRPHIQEKLKQNAHKLPLELAKRVNPTWVLVHALEHGNDGLALEAIKAGANPNAVDSQGVSVLEVVMFHPNLKNSEKIIQRLLKAGAWPTHDLLKRLLEWVTSLEHPEEKSAFIFWILRVEERAGKMTQEELAFWRQFFLEAQEFQSTVETLR